MLPHISVCPVIQVAGRREPIVPKDKPKLAADFPVAGLALLPAGATHWPDDAVDLFGNVLDNRRRLGWGVFREDFDLGRYQARAAARKLLYETLRSECEAARRSYVAPLRREIESLGKIVFGPDFGIELNDLNLSVVSRTLQGRTIPYASLSIGAQEQSVPKNKSP